MKEIILKNNLKIIYSHRENQLTSICISLNAGAGAEDDKMGVAHAVEHMVYKGTRKRSETKINEELSDIFGFQNAMTNYPYVIYYGTLLSEDIERGIELFSDVLLNPIFDEKGFNEEMNVIKEELEEWDEEAEQFCEDKLFYNIFQKRRIKRPIIGTQDSLDEITVKDIKEFYDKNYFPGNTSISIVTSVEFEKIVNIVEKYFGYWKCSTYKNKLKIDDCKSEEINLDKIFFEKREGIKNARVQAVFPLDKLNHKELNAFRIFNQYFGEGVNSILFDTLRTKNSLVYDVLTRIAHENYLKMYKITFTTSKEKVEKAIDLLKGLIENINSQDDFIKDMKLEKLIKSYKLKRLFREEQSIVLAKELATYDTMFKDYSIYIDELDSIDDITLDDIYNSVRKVFRNFSIQVVY
ncbi:pitrilysin family protein [uncultured Clostridium sp.]|uniref:M16 family metallopeptidase n=1 Tax=uncultured Clostridium sp. TaxID=59620 RepID=UPI0025E2E120|nr:pitrilysin family protein [uncultured Clostridium sp.]